MKNLFYFIVLFFCFSYLFWLYKTPIIYDNKQFEEYDGYVITNKLDENFWHMNMMVIRKDTSRIFFFAEDIVFHHYSVGDTIKNK